MATYAAFLRGINVGGHRVKSPELRAILERVGFRDVHTFRASGNLVFAADSESPRELIARIEAGLLEALGYEAPTFLRTAGELRTIAGLRPFAQADVEASTGKLQVAILSERLTAGASRRVLALASDDDRLAFGQRELLWLPRGGMSDSMLDLKAIEKLLGPMTIRTMNTIAQITERYFAS